MRKVRFSAAMSLDGFIAGPNGEYDWIIMDPDIDFSALFQGFDTVIMGRKSFQQTGGKDGGMPGMRTIVFSTTLKPTDYPKVEISANPTETLSAIKANPGGNIWLFGGGELFRSLLGLNLVDEVEIGLIPILLGNGIPFLPVPAQQTNLKLRGHEVYGKTGIVMLRYELN